MKIGQTLHGYADGHRLLATSPDVSTAALRRLDRTTDLTGYLPNGVDFDVYHTGYPIEDRYALSATWLDPTAPRGGAVLTHTLLLPLDLLRAGDPWRWTQLHRRPASSKDVTAFDTPILASEPDTTTPALPPPELLALYFGHAKRPVLWTGGQADLVNRLWPFLWPTARTQFRFCTMALQPLRDGDVPFDLLQLPIQATSAFHALATTHPWFRPDEPITTVPDWARDLNEDGGATLRARIESWERETATTVRPEQVPQFVRLDELRPAIWSRLGAARTFIDLLARLDPNARHPLWDEGLPALISKQGDAALKPRPLWDLTDLLQRPQLKVWLDAEEPNRTSLHAQIVKVVTHRLAETPDLAAPMLPALFRHWRDLLGPPAFEALVNICDEVPEAVPLILRAASEPSQMDVLAAALRSAPRPIRPQLIAEAELRPALIESLVEMLGDPGLTVALWQQPPTSMDLHRSASAWDRMDRVGSLGELLQAAPAEARLTWAFDDELELEDGLEIASTAVRELNLDLATLAHRCEATARGPAIFAHAVRYRSGYQISEALRAAPRLAERLLPSAHGSLREAVAEALPPLHFLAEGTADAGFTSLGYSVSSRLAIELLRLTSSGELTGQNAACWLRQSSVDRVVSNLRREDLRAALSGQLARWARLLADNLDIMALRTGPQLCHILLDSTSTTELDEAAPDLARLMRSQGSWVQDLKVVVAHATRRYEPQAAQALLALSFPAVHRAIRKSYRPTIFWWPWGEKKDETEWERWLAALARRRNWSPGELSDCAGDSRILRDALLKNYS